MGSSAAPAASSWHTLASGVDNTVIPSMLVTKAGTELVSFETPLADTISVARAGGAQPANAKGTAKVPAGHGTAAAAAAAGYVGASFRTR